MPPFGETSSIIKLESAQIMREIFLVFLGFLIGGIIVYMAYETTTYKRQRVEGGQAVPRAPRGKSPWNVDSLTQPEFIWWLSPDPQDRQRFVCRVCDRSYAFSQRTCLTDHIEKQKHIRLFGAAEREGRLIQNVAVGSVTGFYVTMKKDVLHLQVLNCVCHTSAIIAEKSSKELPSEVESLMRKFCTCGTRWLEGYKCYSVLFEYWDPLLNYFTVEVFKHQEDQERIKILGWLQDRRLQALVAFLGYNLDFFNKFNAQYQAKELLAPKLWRSIETLMSNIASNHVRPEALPHITSIDFNLAENARVLHEIVVGENCLQVLNRLPPEDVTYVRQFAEKFYVKFIIEMRSRLLEHRPLLENLIFLEPSVALAEDRNFSNIEFVCTHYFTQLNLPAVQVEWQRLPQHFQPNEIAQYVTLDAESFWKIVIKLKLDDRLLFPALTELTAIVSTIPHSNAEPERVFSDVNEFKDWKSNRTLTELLNCRCFIRSNNEAYPEQNALNFEPENEHFRLFNSGDMYGKAAQRQQDEQDVEQDEPQEPIDAVH
ncbi:hypothetical protein QAD02_009513 [Eretmocerus hayati]|uniref:Uncharacterized protein n=1 Tax=Eretmocerus hayati TaxID=131215 RepID=A0ACC2N9M5_9HYME|nr:hypothetical protein QAD02_009513 [Eretmocerus hayati]